MLHHPELMQILVADHVARLRRDAQAVPARRSRRAVDTRDVELRLCRVSDDVELDQLSQLDGHPVPAGRMVVAVVRDRIVAALPLAGGTPLRDPFVRTEHLLPLLRLRAAQLRDPAPRRSLFPLRLLRGSLHA